MFNLGTLWALLKIKDELSPAIKAAQESIDAATGKIGRSFDTLAAHRARLNTLFDSFSGDKIIRSANEYATAVQHIGGASQLTASEQAKVNRVVSEAIEKYRVLGQEAPARLLALRDATAQVHPATENMLGSLSRVAAMVGIGFSVGAVVNFGRKVFDSASEIHDMAERIGVSIEAVQGFKFAAEQAGSSLDAVGTAINKMNANLAGGDKATVQALTDAGLRFSDIRAMAPEDAFLAIADAIQKIPDPMTQADVALQLFGKGAKDLLPAIKEGFRDVADGATKMSEETVKALEAAQDAWGRLANAVVIYSGTIIATSFRVFEQVTKDVKHFGVFIDTWMKSGIGAAIALADAMGTSAERTKDTVLSLSGQLGFLEGQTLDLAEAHTRGASAATKQAAGLQAILNAAISLRNGLSGELPGGVSLATGLGFTPYSIPGIRTQTGFGLPEMASYPGASGAGGLNLSKSFLQNLFGSTKQFGADFASTIMAAIQGGGSAISAAGSWVGSKLGTGIASTLTSGMSGWLGGALNSILPGIGSLLGPLLGKIWGGIKSLFGGNQTKDLINDTFGSYDALREKLLVLGNEGERLWIELTQRTGKGDKSRAAALIQEITEKLAAQKVAEQEVAQAATESATVQNAALEAIDSQLKSLYDSVAGEAPEEVMGVVEAAARARIAQLEEERKALNSQLDDATESAGDAVADVGGRLQDNQGDWRDWSDSAIADIEKVRRALGGFAFPSPPDLPSYASGTDGYQYFGTGTPVMLHGWEQVSSLNQGGGGTVQITVRAPVYLDGREVGEGIGRVVVGRQA